MLLPLLTMQETPKTPLIIEDPVAIVEQLTPAEVPLTVQEKIDSNFYECDESIQFIRADTAECLNKPVNVQVSRQNTPQTIRNVSKSRSGSPPLSWWGNGQCTQWVASQRSVGQWNNARDWTWQAKRDGWSTGSTPVVGAIGQKGNHVVYVTGVNSDGTFNLSEMNYRTAGVITYRTVSSSGWNFIY